MDFVYYSFDSSSDKDCRNSQIYKSSDSRFNFTCTIDVFNNELYFMPPPSLLFCYKYSQTKFPKLIAYIIFMTLLEIS